MANVTAFVLSEEISAAEEGAQIAGLPGVWQYDRPVLPAALGMTLQDLRDLVDELDLPLAEVSVPKDEAYDDFPPPVNHFPSAPEGSQIGGVTAELFTGEEEPPPEEPPPDEGSGS